MKSTAQEAIAQSIAQNEIVHLDYSQEVAEDLLVESEDNVEANGVTEFWGTTDDGDTWRVHLNGVECEHTFEPVQLLPDTRNSRETRVDYLLCPKDDSLHCTTCGVYALPSHGYSRGGGHKLFIRSDQQQAAEAAARFVEWNQRVRSEWEQAI